MRQLTAIEAGFAKALQFSGRTTRSEFWWFAPIGLNVGLFFVVVLAPFIALEPKPLLVFLAFALATLPVWSAASRRLRGAGKKSRIILYFFVILFAHHGYTILIFEDYVSLTSVLGQTSLLYYLGGFLIIILIHYHAYFLFFSNASCRPAPTLMRSPHD